MGNEQILQRLRFYGLSLRYLRPIQVYARIALLAQGRILERLPRYRQRYLRRVESPQSVYLLDLPIETEWLASRFSGTARGEYSFLNVPRNLGHPPCWFPDDVTQLWLYNLHYFEYAPLVATLSDGYERIRTLVRSWIESCPIGRSPAWDPYPTALRIRNWIKAYQILAGPIEDDESFACELQGSLRTQLRFLESHLEYHLLGNHLLEDGCSLLLGGLFFSGPEADRWRSRGESIVKEQVEIQILSDGGHDERSPMYHLIILALLRETAAGLASHDSTVPTYLSRAIERMEKWGAAMVHPDGEIPLFNDAAFGITQPLALQPEPEDPPVFEALEESGYFLFREPEERHVLFADCGALGPDHQPGHGHCDALSFELSVGGKRLIVDSGVESYYANLSWRNYYRSTRAHNTLMIDEEEQSEIWSRFRVARRARTRATWTDDERLSSLCAIHDGYTRLPNPVVHHRWFLWIDRRFWLITDYLSGEGEHTVNSFLHFHPEVLTTLSESHDPGRWRGEIERESSRLQIFGWGSPAPEIQRGELEPIQGWYAPEFGRREVNEVWQTRQNTPLPAWQGMLLWPGAGAVAIEPSQEEKRVILSIESDDQKYRIEIDAQNLTVELSL